MIAYRRNLRPPTPSLAAEIGEAERRLRHRQLSVKVRVARLGRTLRQGMTAPVTLIGAGAVGFLIGEVTHRPTPAPEETDRPQPTGLPFFETVLDLIRFATWMHTLFPGTSEEQSRPAATSCSAEETTPSFPNPPPS
jgi:hypothetical protein